MRQIILSLFLFSAIQLLGQGNENSINLEGTVLVKGSKESLPYVNILCLNKHRGSITNAEGEYRMDNLSIGDTLSFSFIGYKTYQYIVDANTRKTIELEVETELLNEVFILADSDLLYQLISSSRKKKGRDLKSAKTYYSLASYSSGKRVEMLEAYYNGIYSPYDLKDLKFKNGRIALTDNEGRFFLSTETSKALYMHKSTQGNDYFPISPTELGIRKLRKAYELNLESRFSNDRGHIVYVINAQAKDQTGGYFDSKVWLDSNAAQILRQELNVKEANNHPFDPIAHMGELNKVGLKITKSYQLFNEVSYLQSIDFKYRLEYQSKQNVPLIIQSEAILYAFDYEKAFKLPHFSFSSGLYEDYRKINASPYNEYFWENYSDFALKEDQSKNAEFLAKGASIDNRKLFSGNEYFERGFLEHPYVFWSKERVLFRIDPEKAKSQKNVLPSDRYHLEVQLYLDYNFLNDSLHVNATTVFDPYKTYCYLPNTNVTKAFINIYFDLMEIERRRMLLRIEDSDKESRSIDAIYNETQAQCEQISKRYFSEVRRGTDLEALTRWNQIIVEELNIDNLKLFVPENE